MARLLMELENEYRLVLFLDAPRGFIIVQELTTVFYEKINKTRLNKIQFFLEDSNYDPVDFNDVSLTFTRQVIKT